MVQLFSLSRYLRCTKKHRHLAWTERRQSKIDGMASTVTTHWGYLKQVGCHGVGGRWQEVERETRVTCIVGGWLLAGTSVAVSESFAIPLGFANEPLAHLVRMLSLVLPSHPGFPGQLLPPSPLRSSFSRSLSQASRSVVAWTPLTDRTLPAWLLPLACLPYTMSTRRLRLETAASGSLPDGN